MSTIKVNELATSAISLTDFLVKANSSGLATKTTIQALINKTSAIGGVSFKGSLTIAQAALPESVDGWYFANESGNYVVGGTTLAVTVSNNLAILIIGASRTTFVKVDIPVNITIDAVPTDGSTNAVQSEGAFDAIFSKGEDLISSYTLSNDLYNGYLKSEFIEKSDATSSTTVSDVGTIGVTIGSILGSWLTLSKGNINTIEFKKGSIRFLMVAKSETDVVFASIDGGGLGKLYKDDGTKSYIDLGLITGFNASNIGTYFKITLINSIYTCYSKVNFGDSYNVVFSYDYTQHTLPEFIGGKNIGFVLETSSTIITDCTFGNTSNTNNTNFNYKRSQNLLANLTGGYLQNSDVIPYGANYSVSDLGDLSIATNTSPYPWLVFKKDNLNTLSFKNLQSRYLVVATLSNSFILVSINGGAKGKLFRGNGTNSYTDLGLVTGFNNSVPINYLRISLIDDVYLCEGKANIYEDYQTIFSYDYTQHNLPEFTEGKTMGVGYYSTDEVIAEDIQKGRGFDVNSIFNKNSLVYNSTYSTGSNTIYNLTTTETLPKGIINKITLNAVADGVCRFAFLRKLSVSRTYKPLKYFNCSVFAGENIIELNEFIDEDFHLCLLSGSTSVKTASTNVGASVDVNYTTSTFTDATVWGVFAGRGTNIQVDINTNEKDFPTIKTGKTVTLIGDSITDWCDSPSNNGVQYIGYDKAINRYINFRNVVNEGYSGIEMAGTIGFANTKLAGLVSTDYYIIYLGTNDFAFPSTVGVKSDYDNNTGVNTFFGAFRVLVNGIYALNPFAKIIIFTPTHRNYGTLNSWNSVNSNGNTLNDFSEAIRTVCRFNGFYLVDLMAESQINRNNFSLTTYDSLHPNTRGYQEIAESFIAKFYNKF